MYSFAYGYSLFSEINILNIQFIFELFECVQKNIWISGKKRKQVYSQNKI